MTVIAISGMPGCGSTTVGRLLAKKLNLKFFSIGKWNKEQLLSLEGRETKTETENSIEMWKNEEGASKKFHEKSDDMARDIAKKGNVVMDGKLVVRMLKGLYDFSVWLKADEKIRAARYAGRDNITEDEALKRLEEKQKMERENWQRIYGFDYFDQEKEADLVIDTGDKKPEEIVDLIISHVIKKK